MQKFSLWCCANRVMTSQITMHFLLVIVSLSWALSYIYWKPATRELNPFLFATTRSAAMVLTLAPIVLLVDIRYQFPREWRIPKATNPTSEDTEAVQQNNDTTTDDTEVAQQNNHEVQDTEQSSERTVEQLQLDGNSNDNRDQFHATSNSGHKVQPSFPIIAAPLQHVELQEVDLHEVEQGTTTTSGVHREGEHLEAPLTTLLSSASISDKQPLTVTFLLKKAVQFAWGKIPGPYTSLKLALCGSMITVFNNLTFAQGLHLTTPFITAIFQQLIPVWTSSLSLVFKMEERSLMKAIGILFAILGSVLSLILNNFTGNKTTSFEFSWWSIIGMSCFIASTFFYSCFLLMQKHLLGKGIPPFTVTFWSFLFGSIVITALSSYYIVEFNWLAMSNEALFGVIFGAVVGGTVAFSLQTMATKYLTPTIVSIYNTLLPIFSATTSYLILGEYVSPLSFIGGILISIGVLLVAFAKYRETKRLETEKKKQEETANMDTDTQAISDLDAANAAVVPDISEQKERKDELSEVVITTTIDSVPIATLLQLSTLHPKSNKNEKQYTHLED